jgi:hypothetical protein
MSARPAWRPGAELEALAVHIVAVGNLEGHRDGMPVHHARRKLERLGRIEEILGAGRLQQERDQRQQRRQKTDKTGMESSLRNVWSLEQQA